MSVWIVLALLVAAGLVVLLLVGVRRPRTADEALGQPTSTVTAAPPTASAGTSPLRTVIQALMSGRSTGLLTVSSPLGETCTIAFLFGHMFHAECGSVEGEEALRMALSWTSPMSSFNPKAQLPTKETITRVIDSLSP
jgi:uncharacterized protein DUF4388